MDIYELRRKMLDLENSIHELKKDLDIKEMILGVYKDMLKDKILERYGYKCGGKRIDDKYGESWTCWALFTPDKTDEEILDYLEWDEYYGGPGRVFSRKPYIVRTKTKALALQSGGLDI